MKILWQEAVVALSEVLTWHFLEMAGVNLDKFQHFRCSDRAMLMCLCGMGHGYQVALGKLW
jgi:hypothetical protein